MDNLMRWLAPKGTIATIVRLFGLLVLMTVANIAYWHFFDEHPAHDISYYVFHSLFVGGPFLAFFLAVSAFQVKLQRKLSRLSRKDGLTGLNNRRSFFEMVDQARVKSPNGILMMLDADWFKDINDKHGHRAGDTCLKSIAFMLRRNIRQTDLLGRLGGEEFGIFLRDSTMAQAKAIARRLTVPIPFKTAEGAHLSVTLSIGLVTTRPDATLDEVFHSADKALYSAKDNGRARLVVWDEMQCAEKAAT